MSIATLYRRETSRGGRVRYVPAGEAWDAHHWPHGAHLVTSRPGCVETQYHVRPARAEVAAALSEVRDAMREAMRSALELRPETGRMADAYGVPESQVRAAWEAWVALMGDTSLIAVRGSITDVVDAGLRVLAERMEE